MGAPGMVTALDPAMQFVLDLVQSQPRRQEGRRYLMLEADANLGHDTIRAWLYRKPSRHGRGPTIATVRAALQALGYDLEVVPLRQSNSLIDL